MPVKKIATQSVKATVSARVDGATKVLHEEEKIEEVVVELPDLKKGERYGSIRCVPSVKLSKNFQSVGIEIGFTEYPVVCTLGEPGANQADFEKVYDLATTMLVNKSVELQDLLKTLAAAKS